jgi:hypothetical protein
VDGNIAICVIRNSDPYVAILSHKKYLELFEKAKKYDAQMEGGKKK